MVSKLMLVFVATDVVFAMCGGLLVGFSLIAETNMRATPTTDNAAQRLLLNQCPLTAGVVNAALVFITFVFSVPAFFLPSNRGWLRMHGWLVVFCATFTLGLGLAVWVETLTTRKNLGAMWAEEVPLVQSLLQQKFNCCGYFNSTSPQFIQDNVCTDKLVAAQKGGCIGKFSSFANGYLDLIFTAAFGIVGVDVVLILCVAMVLKFRQEQERYRHIDEKNGLGAL
ncbi:tetraspanin [Lindgomyces ingoldianus]|uniref:Tetraspanin n=1 Tax=Lindgomyces ingoldianus TaxID=673940 RepID=A0ACB6QHB2_9PLEO|nr:tetraspanin [Lindgomyces ingoldianus]KAF2465953.1 tetraspanin [Lindgomyces ingoldianus]